jgi:hypothetical protein
MRIDLGAVHRGAGDLVPGKFSVPQNPVGGMSGLVPGRFSIPENPFGMSGLGCGSDCNCGPCRGGMGAVDLSLTGTGIASSIGITGTTIPNWAFYAAGGAVVLLMLMPGGSKRRR